MKKEGAIILGIGGDNSKGAAGTFYEGVMTSGYPSAATESRGPGQHRRGRLQHRQRRLAGRPARSCPGVSSSKCVDNNNGSGTNGNKVQIWTCDGNAPAQNWTVNSNGTLTIDGGCMDITGANYTNGTLVEWWTCNGGANQQWQAQNGELVNPASGKCLDDPAPTPPTGRSSILYLQRRRQPEVDAALTVP